MNTYIKNAIKAIQERLPQTCTVEYKEVSKLNDVKKDGFIIHKAGSCVCPAFYLSEEEQYTISPEEFAERIVKAYEQQQKLGMIAFNTDNFYDLDWVRKNVIFEIVHKDRNTDNMSYIAIPDTNLAITYKVRVNRNACFLQDLFGKSCKVLMDKLACPFWTKLQGVPGTI